MINKSFERDPINNKIHPDEKFFLPLILPGTQGLKDFRLSEGSRYTISKAALDLLEKGAKDMPPSIGYLVRHREYDTYVLNAKDELTGKDVVVKIFRGKDQPLDFEQMTREARIIANLNHPNIVRVHDVSLVAGKYPAIIEEKLVRALEVNEVFSTETLIRLASQIGAALDYMHAKGFVHNDVKASNIFIRDDGSFVLGDFDNAKTFKKDSKYYLRSDRLTNCVASPEQYWGLEGPASDQHSLAATIYFLITGYSQAPFTKADEENNYGHMSNKQVLLRQSNLDNKVYAVLNRAMMFYPQDRYSSCGEFVADLTKVLRETNFKPSFSLINYVKKLLGKKIIPTTEEFLLHPSFNEFSRDKRRRGPNFMRTREFVYPTSS